MAYTDKIKSLLARPNEDLVNKDDVSPWLKYSARGLGTVGGGFAIFFGIWSAISIALGNVSAFAAGVWQMMAGFLVIVVEAPCCCMFLDFVGTLSTVVDNRPYWNRGALYLAIALPPIFLAFSLSTLFGSGMIFGTGVLYGFMALGKKAPIEQMQTSAVAPAGTPGSSLIDNEGAISKTAPIAGATSKTSPGYFV